MPEVITRKEAIERGLKRYFTGKPCRNGHIAQRNLASDGCYECAKIRMVKFRKMAAVPVELRRDVCGKCGRGFEYSGMRRRFCSDYCRNQMHNAEYYLKHKNAAKRRAYKYKAKVSDLIAVLRDEMPELLKEFGL